MGLLRNANYIKNVYKHACATPGPVVLIETALEAAIPTLISLNQFSCTDIVKLKAGISWKCGKQLKAAAKGFYGPKRINNTHFIYSLGAAQVEKGLWWWFVADLGVEFFANWMTLIYEESDCELPNAGYLQCGLSSLYLDPPGSPHGTFMDTSSAKQCVSIRGNVVTIPAGCEATVSYTARWIPFLNNPASQGTVTSWLQEDDGRQHDVVTGNGGVGGQEQWTGGGIKVKGNLLGDRQFAVVWSLDKGTMGIAEGNVYVSTQGKHFDIWPTGCTPRPLRG